MPQLPSAAPVPYAHRGAVERRRQSRRRAALLATAGAAAVVLARQPAPDAAVAAPVPGPALAGRAPTGLTDAGLRLAVSPHADRAGGRAPGSGLRDGWPDAGWGTHAGVQRWARVFGFAARYGITPELAGAIHDAAVAEGIEPELGFRLVRAESEFDPRATSPVGAVGLTQLMPATARHFAAGITRERLYDPHVNLRIGFRYLRGLIREYRSLRLALLVYNRGPAAVDRALAAGEDPANGYERVVARGYRGRGTVD